MVLSHAYVIYFLYKNAKKKQQKKATQTQKNNKINTQNKAK